MLVVLRACLLEGVYHDDEFGFGRWCWCWEIKGGAAALTFSWTWLLLLDLSSLDFLSSILGIACLQSSAMALFGNRARAPAGQAPAANTATNTPTTTTKRRWGLGRGGGGFGRGRQHTPYAMHSRPSFGQWLRVTWLDILTMVAMGAIGLGVSRASTRDANANK